MDQEKVSQPFEANYEIRHYDDQRNCTPKYNDKHETQKSSRTCSGLSIGQNRAVETLEQIVRDGLLGTTLDVGLLLRRFSIQAGRSREAMV